MHGFVRRAQVCLFAASVFIGTAHAAMTTSGQFAASENGGATYTIPIQVPPGTAGIEPKLALSYSSQNGNGLLGVGWSLSGLSAITRCPRTMAEDGVHGGVNYDANDRYCLDGQRLIPISGANGANLTEYRTELDSFAKIVSYTGTGAGPSSFQVWTKSGQRMQFGVTTSSRIQSQDGLTNIIWALYSIQDTKGNYLTVNYLQDTGNGDYWPLRIDYTANVNTGVAANNYVQFVYDASGSRPDMVPAYHAGSMMRHTVRLTKVQTYAANALVKEYRIAYEAQPAPSTNRSRLSTIAECDASGVCLPANTFSWQNFGASQFAAGTLWTGGYGTAAGWTDTNIYPRLIADVNGDGLPDVVAFATSGVFVSLNTGSGFGTSTMWTGGYGTDAGFTNMSVYPRFVVDVNGDGLPDIVAFESDGVHVSLNTGSGFGTSTLWTGGYGTDAGFTNMSVYPRFVVDVNGDGLPDIVAFESSGVYVSLNTGWSFGTSTLWTGGYGTDAGFTNTSTYPRYVVDMNGDGLADIVAFESSGVYVSLNTGSGFGPSTLWISGFGPDAGYSNDGAYPRYLADMNGDGLPDIVGFAANGVYVALNTGKGFAPSSLWTSGYGTAAGWTDTNTYPRSVVDVNGDGLPDIVAFASTGGVYISLNTGSGFGASTQWGSGYGPDTGYTNNTTFPRFLVDVTGDGLTDIVGFASGDVQVSPLNASFIPDLVTSIASGLTAATTIQYKPLTNKNLYAKDSGTNASSYPVVDLQFPLYAVSSVASSNGVGGTLTTNYSYGGLKADTTGRGLLGFRWMQTVQAETGITVRTDYRQDWPYTGSASTVKKTLAGGGNGGLLSQVVNSYQCVNPASGAACTIAPGQRYFPYVSQSVESNWDLNGAALPTATTSQQYDNWGNPTQIVVSTSDGYSKTTANTYTNDTTNWYLGRLTRASVTSTSP